MDDGTIGEGAEATQNGSLLAFIVAYFGEAGKGYEILVDNHEHVW